MLSLYLTLSVSIKIVIKEKHKCYFRNHTTFAVVREVRKYGINIKLNYTSRKVLYGFCILSRNQPIALNFRKKKKLNVFYMFGYT